MPLVSEQVTDAVTQSNVKVVGEAPAMAMGNLYQALSHSHGLMYENSVNAQLHGFTSAQAAATQGVMQIYSVDTVSDAIAISRMLAPT
ncbi:MAG: RebB family R body protein [Oceanicaulis sp.]|jgi:hypothetical protein